MSTILKTKRLFILAEARSGSSWLMETLDSHQDITLLPELYNHAVYEEASVFKQIPLADFSKCIDYLEKELARAKENKYVGCKILLNQLNYIAKNFYEYFIDFYKDAYFIFLYRENMVAAQISLRIAHTYNLWHHKKEEEIKEKKVTIAVDHLLKNLNNARSLRNRILEKLENSAAPNIKLTYEELFINKQKSIEQICRFLDVPYKSESIKFSAEKKGNPFKAAEIIENYEEVKDQLKQYPEYYRMLLKT